MKSISETPRERKPCECCHDRKTIEVLTLDEDFGPAYTLRPCPICCMPATQGEILLCGMVMIIIAIMIGLIIGGAL